MSVFLEREMNLKANSVFLGNAFRQNVKKISSNKKKHSKHIYNNNKQQLIHC